jgi:hypothetical protein
MLLGVVPLKRHITDRVPRRHLHRTAIPITRIPNAHSTGRPNIHSTSSGLGDASTEKASFSPRPRRNRSLPPPRPRPLTRRSPRRCLRGTANPVAGAKPTHARVSGVARTGGFAAYYQATGEERNWRSEKNTHLVVLGRPDAVAPRRVVGGEVVPLVVPVAVPHSRRRKASLAPAAEDEGGRWRMGGGAG